MSPVLLGVAALAAAAAIVGTVRAPRVMSVVLWALVATIFVTAALLLVLPGPFAEVALWLALSVPLTWVAFQFWCYWDPKGWRVALGLIAVSVVGGVIVFVVEPPV